MNYLALIKRFWRIDMERPISPTDTRLYFYLVDTCSSLGWKNPFGHSDRYLAAKLGMSVNSIRDARIRLRDLGLIKFEIPEKGSKGIGGQMKYKLIESTVSKIDTVLDTVLDTDSNTDNATDTDTVSDTNNKQNKTKQNKEGLPRKKEFCSDVLGLNEFASEFFEKKYIGIKSAVTFEKLLKVEKYTPNKIKEAIKNARSDSFWESNFLSPVKLRSKDKNGVLYIDIFLKLKPKTNNSNKWERPGQIMRPTDQKREEIIRQFDNND